MNICEAILTIPDFFAAVILPLCVASAVIGYWFGKAIRKRDPK